MTPVPHQELEGDALHNIEDFEDSVARIGSPMATSSISTFERAVFNLFNDPEQLARFADEGTDFLDPSTLGGTSLSDQPTRVQMLQDVAEARIHQLALEGPTPSPATSNDLGMSERGTFAGAMRSGATVEEALQAALEDDASDADAEVGGPLAGEPVDFGLSKSGEFETPRAIVESARSIARSRGLIEPEPSPAPAASSSPTSSSSGPGIAAAIATVLFAATAGLLVARGGFT